MRGGSTLRKNTFEQIGFHIFWKKASECLPRIDLPNEAPDPKIKPRPVKTHGKTNTRRCMYLQHFRTEANF